MRRSELAAFLRERPRVGDGALGTALYAGGIASRRSFEDLNRSDPDRVRAVHTAHLAAGAEVISTNTFGANPWKLGRHGLASEVAKINAAGARVARSAVRPGSLVLGSVGPSGEVVGPFDEEKAPEFAAGFREQIAALVESGVDAVLIETFTSLTEARLALSAAREVAPDIGVIVLMTFSEQATTVFGVAADQAAGTLERDGADAVGSNCGVGPDTTLTALERMRNAVSLPLVAQPNAGIPERTEGRFLYPSSPDYVAHYAKRYLRLGVSLIGGCCGTGAEHIGAVAGVVRAASAGARADRVRAPARPAAAAPAEEAPAEIPAVPVPERSGLARCLAEGRFAVSVEMDPPRGAEPGKFLARVGDLADAGIRFVNVADGPRATARMSAIAFAALLERSGEVETILHYQCRDRNLIGIQSDLLGAHALGIRNLLAVTGDPPKLGDYPHATPVFDVDSIGLVRILRGLNHGLDLAGNPLGAALPFHIGVGANPAAADLEGEMGKFERKVQAGAQYCLTQPVYETRLLERFVKDVRGYGIPVLAGVLPLVSSRNAEFLHNEVPGMSVPQPVRERLAAAPTRQRAREVGVSVARDMVAAARDLVAGVYVMPPFNRFDLAIRSVTGLV
ncbi:MAG: bifunctional homocysteine S-methyltransferase/methylenetetrahydrofolate reductase [Acidobacteria bacterium]|nr:bifunctional homocysteine S-methyltransferase/methylenetetrahydrofolate reductase [Acidobacteriota bacterium]MYF14889.1 bifunctional homocysteine S-methyltransferase/methylenetetrahydrofolate reductase [Acidobacteriota bacterium]MYI97708.1 bifunctional homocysteine S-methyltransferase/methylenetetrahydrofolate reductase [Acidobacteriota bacterium]